MWRGGQVAGEGLVVWHGDMVGRGCVVCVRVERWGRDAVRGCVGTLWSARVAIFYGKPKIPQMRTKQHYFATLESF